MIANWAYSTAYGVSRCKDMVVEKSIVKTTYLNI